MYKALGLIPSNTYTSRQEFYVFAHYAWPSHNVSNLKGSPSNIYLQRLTCISSHYFCDVFLVPLGRFRDLLSIQITAVSLFNFTMVSVHYPVKIKALSDQFYGHQNQALFLQMKQVLICLLVEDGAVANTLLKSRETSNLICLQS